MFSILAGVLLLVVDSLAAPKPMPTLLTEPMILKKYDASQLEAIIQGLQIENWCAIHGDEAKRMLLTIRPLYAQKVKELRNEISWKSAQLSVEGCKRTCFCGFYLFLFESRRDIPKASLRHLKEESQEAKMEDLTLCVQKRPMLCQDVIIPSLRALSMDSDTP